MAKVNQCSMSPEYVEQQLNSTLDSADPIRAESLVRLRRTREVKLKGQEREKIRLTAKLGENHPRVQSLQTKVEQNKVYVRTLKVESARAQTEAPVVESDSWVVHGRVLNKELAPVPGMKVALYDKGGCPIQTCGREYTDNTGYFKLTIKNVSSDPADSTTGNEPMDGFIYVIDSNNVTIHEDKRPLPIVAGQVQYIEIILDGGGVVGTPIPDTGRPTQTGTRYLGNSNSKELHDLKNQQPGCQIDEIKTDHRVNFKTQKEALALGYDYCAYCFGKDKSKR